MSDFFTALRPGGEGDWAFLVTVLLRKLVTLVKSGRILNRNFGLLLY